MIKLILAFFQSISARIIGNKRNYLNAPDEILSWYRVNNIWKLWHVTPSLIVAIVIAVKLLPLISNAYAEELKQNGAYIPLAALLILIPVLILNGIIIERILMRNNPEYKKFVDSTNV